MDPGSDTQNTVSHNSIQLLRCRFLPALFVFQFPSHILHLLQSNFQRWMISSIWDSFFFCHHIYACTWTHTHTHFTHRFETLILIKMQIDRLNSQCQDFLSRLILIKLTSTNVFYSQVIDSMNFFCLLLNMLGFQT